MQLEIPSYNSFESSMNDQNKVSSGNLPFPLRLYALLDSAMNSEIIGWGSNGKEFKVYDVNRFENETLPHYFPHSTFDTFQRQLSQYGFKRVLKGPSSGAFQHPLFLRGRFDLVATINRATLFRSASSGASTASSLTMSDNEEASRYDSVKKLREEMVTTPTDELISVMLNQMYTVGGHPSSDNLQMAGNVYEDSRFSELFAYKDARGANVMHSNSKGSDTTRGSEDSADPFELLQCHTDRGSDADSIFQYTESGESGSRSSPPLDPAMSQLAANTRRRKNASTKLKQKAAYATKKGQKSPRTPKSGHFFPIQQSAITEITLDPNILSQYGEIYYVPTDGSCPVRIKAMNVPVVSCAEPLPLSARSANTNTTGATTARDSVSTGSEPSSASLSPAQRKSEYSESHMDHADPESMVDLLDSQSLFQMAPLTFRE